jgi:mRNA-degrading endonuclease RelE of RelBE toxin-antitoxin system
MEFIEAPLFTKLLPRYLSDDEYRVLQSEMAANPEAGDVIPDTGGFRKLRWRDPRRRKGKRGGLRVIYYFFRDGQIWLLTIYDKDEVDDLTPEQRRTLKEAIARETEERGRARRTKGQH